MIKRIKIFVFNNKEYKPINKLYTYKNIKYTNIKLINHLRKKRIWFNTYLKEVLNEN